jgi:uncharacterized membrane protein SpoIIM required for sporulation
MDIDRYIAKNAATWQRLQQLVETAQNSVASLSDTEVEEMITLYQRSSAHLSHVRAQHEDREVINQLSLQLSQARQVIYGKRSSGVHSLVRFFTRQLPGATWTIRWPIAAMAALFLVASIGSGMFMYGEPDALSAEIGVEDQKALVDYQFEDYYSNEAAGAFAAKVQTNNITVGLVAFGGGAALAIIPPLIIVNNAIHIGTVAAVMHKHDAADVFWGLIIPHGLLELAAVFVSAGAGFHIGWSLISPGRRTRAAAVADAAATGLTVMVGVVACFIVAGFIEAFVTPSALPVAGRIAIGIVALAIPVLYVVGLGPKAAAEGYRGQISPRRPSWATEGVRLDAWLGDT